MGGLFEKEMPFEKLPLEHQATVQHIIDDKKRIKKLNSPTI